MANCVQLIVLVGVTLLANVVRAQTATTCPGLTMGKPISYAVIIQYTDSTCSMVASGFAAPMLGYCLPVGQGGYYVKADFISATDSSSTSVFTGTSGSSSSFGPLPLSTAIASGDQAAKFSFAVYSDKDCATTAGMWSIQITNVPGAAFANGKTVPTSPGVSNGCYSVSQNPTWGSGTLPSPNYFKTAVLNFCSYSDVTNYINAQAGAGVVALTYGDSACSKIDGVTNYNNLPTGAGFMGVGVCIPSTPFDGQGGGGNSFKIACATDGVLAFTIQTYSDRGCANIIQGNTVTFTPSSTNACSPFSQPQLYGVPLLGSYVVGYCQTSPAITSAATTVLAATQTLSGTIADTPTFRSSFIASVKVALAANQCSSCTVTIVSVTVTTSRRSMVRQLLAAGATVVYNVAAPTASVTAAALKTAVTSPATATALSAALGVAGITATATAPTVTTVTTVSTAGSPTPSPSKVNSSPKTVGNQIATLCIALCVALCVTLYA